MSFDVSKSLLTADSLYERLCSLSAGNDYLVAFSGGLDSHVLLHLMGCIAKTFPEVHLRSVYIDHGLQKESSAWAHHCQQVTTAFNIEHHALSLHLQIPPGESLEAVARKARYQALEKHLFKDEILLTAHHQDDQAETVLLQLLRGSGLDGLAAMPVKCPFSTSYHVRPLLDYCRAQLEEYAQTHNLEYISDPSNKDDRFDRNFLRNSVIPILKQRWPQMGKTLSRSAKLHAEASVLQAESLDAEMPMLAGSKKGTLSASALLGLPEIKQKAALRYWIKKADFKAPSAVQLQHIVTDVLKSALDAMPLVEWSGAEIRRYLDDVYIMSPLPSLSVLTATDAIAWDINHSLIIEQSLPALNPDDLGGLKNVLLEHAIPVTIRFRQGGERIRLKQRQCSISLKNLFQEERVPPWQRERIPLVFANDQLIYIPDLARIDEADIIKQKN
ncbi:MAG: tRNA lysidine(34) synthetase TilS [Thiotrichaceae bacterium]